MASGTGSTRTGKELAMQTESDEIRKYLDDRKREAVKIDPQTAEVTWWYAETLDPYGICNLPPEAQQIGREYFARHRSSEIWVWFGDLPEGTSTKLMCREADSPVSRERGTAPATSQRS